MEHHHDVKNSPPRDSNGWDGKLRIPSEQDASPPESENGDFPEEEFQGESLDADEGIVFAWHHL